MYHLRVINALMEHSKIYQQNMENYRDIEQFNYFFAYLFLMPILFSCKICLWNQNNMSISNHK